MGPAGLAADPILRDQGVPASSLQSCPASISEQWSLVLLAWCCLRVILISDLIIFGCLVLFDFPMLLFTMQFLRSCSHVFFFLLFLFSRPHNHSKELKHRIAWESRCNESYSHIPGHLDSRFRWTHALRHW